MTFNSGHRISNKSYETENLSMVTRRPNERDQLWYDEQTPGKFRSENRPKNMMNIVNPGVNDGSFISPETNNGSVSHRSDYDGKGVYARSESDQRSTYAWCELSRGEKAFSGPEFGDGGNFCRPQLNGGDMCGLPPMSGINVNPRLQFNSANMHKGPQFDSGNMQPRPHFDSNNMQPRPQFDSTNMKPMPPCNSVDMHPRQQYHSANVHPGLQFNGANINPRPQFNSGNMHPRPQLNSGNMHPRPQLNSGNMQPGPQFNSGNMHFRPQLNSGNVHPRPQFNDGNIHPRPQFNYGNVHPRPQFNNSNIYTRPQFNDSNICSRPQMNNGNMFPMPQMDNNIVFPRPQINSSNLLPMTQMNSGNMYPRPQMDHNNMFPRPQMNSGNVFPRPQMDNNMFPRPQMDNNMFPRPQTNSDNVFPRPQFNSGSIHPQPQMNNNNNNMFPWSQFNTSPMAGVAQALTRGSFALSGGSHQQSAPNLDNLAMRKNRYPNPEIPEQKPFGAVKRKISKLKRMKKRISAKINLDKKKLKPWMTNELYAEVWKKNQMYFKAKAANSTEKWEEFRLQRNKVTTLIKEAKIKGGFFIPKEKEDKEESDAEEKPFSCDTCDKSYTEESKLEEHLKEHKKCEIGGCQFEAHPKIIELHKKMQHSTGYAEKISKLNDAGELEKWKNERKSRFPTLQNVQKRKAAEEEKIARGEVIETKDFGKFKKQKCDERHSGEWKSAQGNRGRQRGRSRRGSDRFSSVGKVRTITLHDDSSDSDDESHIKLHKFPGISVLTTVKTDEKNSSEQNAGTSQENFGIDEIETTDINSPHLYTSSASTAKDLNHNVAVQNKQLSTVEDPKILPDGNVLSIISEEVTELQTHHKLNDCSMGSNSVLSCASDGENVNDLDPKGLESDDEGPSEEPIVKEIETTCCVADFNEETSANLVPQSQESEDEGPTVEPAVKVVETTCHVADFTKEIPAENNKSAALSRSSSSKVNSRGRTQHSAPEQKGKANNQVTCKKQNTLLEKLLANDIRHERNVIMQCLRYSVNNNFFGIAGQRVSKG